MNKGNAKSTKEPGRKECRTPDVAVGYINVECECRVPLLQMPALTWKRKFRPMTRRNSCFVAGVLIVSSVMPLFFLPVEILGKGSTVAAARPGVNVWDEYSLLQSLIAESSKWDRSRLVQEALRPESAIFESDKTPLDVVVRRTAALLADLKRMPNAPDLSAESAAFASLLAEATRLGQSAPETQQRELFAKIVAVRRKIAFRNPLLDFDRIIFLKHNKQARGEIHMVDQYLGFNQDKAGGVYVLEKPFGDSPSVRSVLANSVVQSGRLKGSKLEDAGSFVGLDLDYDGKTIAFAFTQAETKLPENASYAEQYCSKEEYARLKKFTHYYFRPESTFHIFKASVDGTNLAQLTDGKWDDYDPVFLPSGRLAFISERSGGMQRCGTRPLPSATLHAMMPDGGDVIQLSWHDTNEWQPSVDNEGLIVYTRWDYVDRDSDVAHHLWNCYPDGRDPRSYHGNYPEKRETRPWMEMSIRAIPGSHRYIATAAPHHGQAYGSLVMIDIGQKDNRRTSQLRRITPEAMFPEAEELPGVPLPQGKGSGSRAEIYGSAWPLSEDYYLCVYGPDGKNYALCLLDSFGNREILYRDEKIACLDPIPLRARPKPPEIPVSTIQAKADQPEKSDAATGTVAVMNVYESELPWPKDTKIAALRIVAIFPKDNIFMNEPNMGYAAQSLGRGVLGTVPVESDGSAYFTMPAGMAVYFQALDERGLAVHTMRSDTYVHPGEKLTCIGCHEDKHTSSRTVAGAMPLALKRAPSAITPETPGSFPLTFPRLVQPVLNSKCLACHDKNQGKAPNLHGDKFISKHGWSEAFNSLQKKAWGMSGGNGTALKQRQYSIPGQDGAMASKLFQMLDKGHNNVKLTPEEMRRITLWLDCNSNFYAAYSEAEKQARGEVVRPKWGIPAWVDFEKLVR